MVQPLQLILSIIDMVRGDDIEVSITPSHPGSPQWVGHLTTIEQQEPAPNDTEVVENFELTIGGAKVILKNATKDLIQIITNIMLKEDDDKEKPTRYEE